MKRVFVWATIALFAGLVRPAAAEMVVIVNKANPAVSLSRTEVEMIYLGKKKLLGDDIIAAPADLPQDAPARRDFFSSVLNKSAESYRLYWLRMIFSGKGHPPVALKSEEEAARFVAATPGGIAFIDSGNLIPGVKAIAIDRKE